MGAAFDPTARTRGLGRAKAPPTNPRYQLPPSALFLPYRSAASVASRIKHRASSTHRYRFILRVACVS